jgi:hypothetical protein
MHARRSSLRHPLPLLALLAAGCVDLTRPPIVDDLDAPGGDTAAGDAGPGPDAGDAGSVAPSDAVAPAAPAPDANGPADAAASSSAPPH